MQLERTRATAATANTEDATAETRLSPTKQPVFPTTPSRRLHDGRQSVPNSPTKGGTMPLVEEHLIPCLNAQKRAVLRALSDPPVSSNISETKKGKGKAKAAEADSDFDNATAYSQLKDLLEGTVVRNEGNSCLLLGPKGSGKSRVFERCLSDLCQSVSNTKPIIIRLSGWVQSDDRLALRQIAIQLAEQTGRSYASLFNAGSEGEPDRVDTQDDDDNPFLDPSGSDSNDAGTDTSLPAAHYLPRLIAQLPKLDRPTVIMVDAFDLFTLHPRQALLYCLLDTVQACQSAQGNKGLAVVGITSRVDVVTLLEKRVKSRFSGRVLRVSNVPREEGWMDIVRRCLLSPATIPDDEATESDLEEWNHLWNDNVEKFLSDSQTKQMIHETYSIVRDVRVLIRILTPVVVRLSPSQPFPASALLQRAVQSQRIRTPFTFLHTLSYPALCLLIASYHSDQKGHPIFNFEMLYEAFRVQLRASTAAPIQLNGTSIGMVKCSRSVMLGAFENLIATRIFVPAAATSATTPKEFVKYRSVVEREDLKKAIEKAGQVSLKKWWSKS
ncbi:hypothetical protein NMY22_g8824 [Coprinellus aureogranulatus]|nr:hypothetical protein NMY22_g8824 [Coprinellus aureogranulatus]